MSQVSINCFHAGAIQYFIERQGLSYHGLLGVCQCHVCEQSIFFYPDTIWKMHRSPPLCFQGIKIEQRRLSKVFLCVKIGYIQLEK